jgi:hypothetical protein
MSIEVSAEDIARNPAWHLYDIDLQRGEMHFLEATPDTFAVSAFLDNRIAYTRGQMHGFPIDSVISAFQQFPPRLAQTDFLFHSSFCCSSLLARSLQFGDRTLVLREPWVLRRLADTRRAAAAQGQGWGAQGEALVDMSLTLLGKTFHDRQGVLIKPTHVANNLAADMLALRPSAKGIVLYSDLESFLVSNLKKSDETKQKMPALARVFDLDTGYTRRFTDFSIEGLDFLQQAAVIWHAQMLRFRELLESPAGMRLKSLDSTVLLADPAAALRAASDFLGYLVTQDELAAALAGPIWTTHAKDPFSAYDKGARERENREVAGQHGDRIRDTLRWAEELLAQHPVGLPLPRALL